MNLQIELLGVGLPMESGTPGKWDTMVFTIVVCIPSQSRVDGLIAQMNVPQSDHSYYKMYHELPTYPRDPEGKVRQPWRQRECLGTSKEDRTARWWVLR